MGKRTIVHTNEHAVQMVARCDGLLKILEPLHEEMVTCQETESNDMVLEYPSTKVELSSGDYVDDYNDYWTNWYSGYTDCNTHAINTNNNLQIKIDEIKELKASWEPQMYWYEEVDD